MITSPRVIGTAAALGLLLGIPASPYVVVENPGGFPGAVLGFVILFPVGVLAGRLLWNTSLLGTAGGLLGAALAAAIAAVVAFVASFAIAINSSLCGNGASIATGAGFLVYGTIGAWGFQERRRLVWAWPLAVIAGAAVSLALTAALPGGHGYCET